MMTVILWVLAGLLVGAAAAYAVLRRRSVGVDDALLATRFGAMRHDLDRVAGLVQQLETSRATSWGRLEQQLAQASHTTRELADTTQALRAALASPQTRGAWGERMAVDVLRHAGMIEGINYLVQATLPSGSRPDITFPLPGDRALHMDVKFPLDNYLRALEAGEAGDPAAADRHRTAFLRDVRARVRELTSRDYIDASSGTLDYVLLFLPNEQVYGFVHEHDAGLLDEALASKVILCSPLTLFAVLAVVRETVDNFALERASHEILGLLTGFRSEWERFVAALDKLGRRIEGMRLDYDALLGVRARGIDRQLERIEAARRAHGLAGVDRPAADVALEQDSRPLRAIGD